MRHKKQSTLRASDVHAQARRLLLDELDLRNYKPCLRPALVVSLLLLASIWQTSLSCACSLVKDPPCRESARKAALALLPRRPTELLAALLRALRHTLPDHLRNATLPAAIDLHQRPFYGRKGTRGSTRRKNKPGPPRSLPYAPLAVPTRWGRFTVGLLPTRP